MRTAVGKWLSIGVAVACGVWGVLILRGHVLPALPALYRTMFGVITLLYGVYRLVLGMSKRAEE